MKFNNRHIPADKDAAYEELQDLDYLHEWTPEQQARISFLEDFVNGEAA